ncbi:dynamin-binding protein-like isoform X1 [Scylla paramamosain]|uniref:dynamin-binding protein-like isoform X1 n=1 Tax=Scylla paramamosain TaxID=85552 RepID=UPI0030834E18
MVGADSPPKQRPKKMKAGDVCRCISDFSGISAEELTLYKNDIVQIHEVVDKHWLRGEGGGSVGLVPSSVLVKVELPPHPSHLPLFVASAEFLPSQPGDLGLRRGDFVVGLNPIDESWWCGEAWGKQGMFPINFVWHVNKDILEVEDTSEKAVRMVGRVKSSIMAQLPEELDLYAGDLVTITHIVDKDWYRGESNGATGIFPKSFVEIVDESSVPSPPSALPEENSFMVSDTPSSFPQTGGTLSDSMLAAPYPSDTPAQPHTADTVPATLGYSAPTIHPSTGPGATPGAKLTPASAPQPVAESTNTAALLSKTSTAWKTVDVDDADLFDDDYFKQNMPGLYSSKGDSSAPSAYTGDTSSALSAASGASASLATTGSRYENIPVSVPEEEAKPSVPSSHYLGKGQQPSEYSYENIPLEPQRLGEDGEALSVGSEHSALLEQHNGLTKMNSLSQKVENYLSSSMLGESATDHGARTVSSSGHTWAYRGPSYTEDNTGIEPYSRAVFSFKAQYPNELTFKKGEIVHLVQHVDSHWTLGRSGDAEGIFPTSYVDIIVDCPHSEEQHFLARPEAPPSASQLVQAVAQYDFQAEQAGDVSMKKGDFLTVIKEVDNNWVMVENTTGSKGMCPKNYLVFLKETETESLEVREPQNKIPDSTSDMGEEQRSRLLQEDVVHQRSRSSSPLSASGKRRSYNKDDFGIKKQDVEQVMARNMASFDATSKVAMGRLEKGGSSSSVFTKREMSPGEHRQPDTQQNPGKPKPMVLPRHSKIVPPLKSAHSVPRTPSTPSTPTTPSTTTPATASTTTAISATPSTTAPATPTTPNTPNTPSTNTANMPNTPSTTTPATQTTPSTTTPATPSTTAPATPSTSISTTTYTTTARTGPFTSTRPAPPPLISPRTKVFSGSKSSPSDTEASSLHKPPPTAKPSQPASQPKPPTQPKPQLQPRPLSQTQPPLPSQPRPKPLSQHQPSIQPQPQPPTQPVYSQVKKTPKKSQKEMEVGDSEKQCLNESNNSTTSSATFPDDVCQLSVASEATYSSETNLSSASAGFVPQRPAPPPPPKLPDTEEEVEEVEEHYYSTAPQEPQGMKAQAVEMVSGESDEDEEETVGEDGEGDTEETTGAAQKQESKASMRRVITQEIVTTEHEYIHDLESLLQVVQLAPSRPGGTQGVHLPSLLGNITEVIDVARKFANLLDQSAYGKEEEVCVGRVFLACAEELCRTYKVYCANHNITVEPLMKKYEQETGSAAFLQWVLKELQQHKIQLLDMRSVLIKPLQRVLKYPLFLDRLVRETPEHHPDHSDLLEAKTAMANAAKEINEYTKRLDLINKYRVESDQSLQGKMQRVSLHSMYKRSSRFTTLISEMLGIMVQTKDLEFDKEVDKFRSMQRCAAVLAQDMDALLQGVKARHRGELGVVKGFIETLLQPGLEVKALHSVAVDSSGRLFETFDNFVRQRVALPTKELVALCEVPDRLILKRNDKLLDYDNAQYKLDRNRDPTRTRILEEELSQAQGTYNALHSQLMMELPVLTSNGMEVLNLATRSLISARMYLQGHLARLYLNLSQALGVSLTGEEEMLTQFRVKYLQQVGEFRQLSFIPTNVQLSLPRPATRSSKNPESGGSRREHETTKTKVVGQYPGELVYVVREVHTPAEVMELTLYPGDHVALLKNKDPLGRMDRWFVDDGDNKGFVRVSCLKPMLGSDRGAEDTTLPPATPGTAVLPSRPAAVHAGPRPSTVPRPAPAPPEQAPPRYEDIFPVVPTTLPQGTGLPQAPPPRYSSEGTATLASQPPLPSKTEPLPPDGDGLHHGDGDYYSPPLDRQPSGEYNSPVSEENNIYEEIDQIHGGCRGENGAAGQEDTSPIYEVIKDGEIVPDEEDLPPELAEPLFYYALYNFGGSDGTQLNLTAGQVVRVLHAVSSDWWFVEERSGKQGYVPASYLTRYT